MPLYCNGVVILSTQITYKKQTNTKIKKTFLILHYSTLKSTVGQYSSWHAGSGIKCTGKKSSWIEEQEEVGDGRVLLSSTQLLLFRRRVASDSWDPMDCSPPGSSVHGIFHARILEWVAISFCRGSSRPRDQTLVFCTHRWIPYYWASREARSIRYSECSTQKHYRSQRMHAHDNRHQTRELTYMIRHTDTCSHLWKFTTCTSVCRRLTVFCWPVWVIFSFWFGKLNSYSLDFPIHLSKLYSI